MHGQLDDVDAGRPLQHLSEECRLRYALVDTRGPFTLAVDRWSRSGQLCSEDFADFVSRTDSGITNSGKQEWVTFTAAHLGTQHPDNRLLRLFTRAEPHAVADAVFDEDFSPEEVGLPSAAGQGLQQLRRLENIVVFHRGPLIRYLRRCKNGERHISNSRTKSSCA